MLFSSYEFLLVFLPITLVIYYLLIQSNKTQLARIALIISSLVFYGFKNIKTLPILIVSIVANFIIYRSILNKRDKILLAVGVSINILFLSFFKYSYFIPKDIIKLEHIIIPLGVSFFTFQQIGFLVDSYRGEVPKYNLLDYLGFVTFFPYIISGPIVNHEEVMEPMRKPKKFNIENFSLALYIFSIGLAKKVLIADYLAQKVALGFDTLGSLTFLQGWISSICYTLQLFFDFSGYSDMAIALGLMFNINIPFNFLSPYKAVSIKEFWNTWHITLGRFLTKYIYFPLGGNRKGRVRTYINIFIIFFISGIWHGVGWMFILWGVLHGIAMIIHRVWTTSGFKMNKILAWFITINFVNIAWVFFRAKDISRALNILKAMTRIDTLRNVQNLEAFGGRLFLLTTIFLIVLVLLGDNVKERICKFNPNTRYAIVTGVLLVISILSINKLSEFIYFKF